MAGYEFSPKQLKAWPEVPRSTYLWDSLNHERTQTTYWKNRAESAERRMQEHECQEGNA